MLLTYIIAIPVDIDTFSSYKTSFVVNVIKAVIFPTATIPL